MRLNPGETIDDKYRVVRLLGAGAMGAVYEGENTRIHRRVAIKVLHREVASNSEAAQRFEREAQAAGRIGSEHVVEVLDLGTLPGGDSYMVMEYLEGESLGQRIERLKRMSAHELAPIAHQILEALAAAHEAGVIHRDLKPDNVFILPSKAGKTDFVKVLDFGVSKFDSNGVESMSMTRTGVVMGTPYYMSPEQARGVKVDARSDLYALGVVLYEGVTGRVPFDAESFAQLLMKIALESPEPVDKLAPGLDAGFAEIIEKAMARDAAARFQTARELQDALAAFSAASPRGPRDAQPTKMLSASGGASDGTGKHEAFVVSTMNAPVAKTEEAAREATDPSLWAAAALRGRRRRLFAVAAAGTLLLMVAGYGATRDGSTARAPDAAAAAPPAPAPAANEGRPIASARPARAVEPAPAPAPQSPTPAAVAAVPGPEPAEDEPAAGEPDGQGGDEPAKDRAGTRPGPGRGKRGKGGGKPAATARPEPPPAAPTGPLQRTVSSTL